MYLCTSIYTARQLSDLVFASPGGKHRMNMPRKIFPVQSSMKLPFGRGLLL